MTKPTLKMSLLCFVAVLLAICTGIYFLQENEDQTKAPVKSRHKKTKNKLDPSSTTPTPLSGKTDKKQPKTKSKPIRTPIGIHGRILDEETLQPITNAMIEIPGISRAKPDKRGRFSISAPLKRELPVYVKAPGYNPIAFRAKASVGISNIKTLKMKAAKTGRLVGQVEYLGEPPKNVYTVFIGQDKYQFPISQRRFVIEKIRIGIVSVGITGVGDAEKIPLIDNNISIKENHTTEINFVIPKQAQFQGRVIDEAGNGVDAAQFMLGIKRVVTRANGSFNTDGLAALYYPKVLLYHQNYGHIDIGPLDLRGKQTDLEYVLRPQGHGSVKGTVPNYQELGAAFYVKLFRVLKSADPLGKPKYEHDRTILIQEGKSFELSNLPPNSYLIKVMAPKQGVSKDHLFKIENNETISINLPLPEK